MIDDDCRKRLLSLANQYAKKQGISVATVARRLHGSFDFFERYKARKCSITIAKYDEMVTALGGQVRLEQAVNTAVESSQNK